MDVVMGIPTRDPRWKALPRTAGSKQQALEGALQVLIHTTADLGKFELHLASIKQHVSTEVFESIRQEVLSISQHLVGLQGELEKLGDLE
jgi:hypothetical protein